MGFLGGKPQKSKSWNKAYGFDINNFGPTVGWGNAATGAMGDILGLSNQGYWVDPANNGVGGDASGSPHWVGGSGGAGGAGGAGGNALGGLQQYFNSSGGQFLLNQGLDGLTNKFTAMGLGRSGATMKAMEQYRQDLMQTKLDNYLGHLGDMSKLGLGAGSLISGAGQVSKGTGASEGAGSTIGAIASVLPFVLSDENAKTKIETIGPWDSRGDGLLRKRFAYKSSPNIMLEGVVAQDVARLRPWALGPRLPNGFLTVNYAKLSEAA